MGNKVISPKNPVIDGWGVTKWWWYESTLLIIGKRDRNMVEFFLSRL